MSLKVPRALVSVEWLYENLNDKDLMILDATLPKVTTKSKVVLEEYQIKNSVFFDIKNVFSDVNAPFPNTVLSEKEFENQAQKIGVNSTSCIVVYDVHGIYSSPRVWWLFKAFGFDNIAVLDGGLPTWKKANYPIEIKQQHRIKRGDFTANQQSEKIINSTSVFQAITNASKQIVDARSEGRFTGTELEPRKEIRNGRIPTSKNLPYSSLLNTFELKSKEELQSIFQKVNPLNKELIFSCGSGITACILALGATIVECKNIAVYDGSWTEWGSLTHLPIEK